MALSVQASYKGVRYLGFKDLDVNDSEFLIRRFKFHELDLEDCMSEQERPKIDEYDKYLFIVLQTPFYNSSTFAASTAEINIFIGQNYLVLHHDGDIKWINEMEKEIRTPSGKKKYLSHGTGYFLYEIVDNIFRETFIYLDRLQREVKTIEKEIFQMREQVDWLEDILGIKKAIITFRRTISPQRAVVSQLEHKNKKFMPEDLEIYFDNVVDSIEKAWQTLEILKEVSETLEKTNESLLTHYMNNTMKVLTIISVTMLPLTFIVGLYGMNVGLPDQGNPNAFWEVLIGMVALVAAMLAIFRWKRWM